MKCSVIALEQNIQNLQIRKDRLIQNRIIFTGTAFDTMKNVIKLCKHADRFSSYACILILVSDFGVYMYLQKRVEEKNIVAR